MQYSKLKYFITSLRKSLLGKGRACPSCGCRDTSITSRKYVVTTLRRCRNCQLLFRSPTTTAEENRAFYQEEYSQGFTTDLPSDELLEEYKENSFSNTEKDYSERIDLVMAAGTAPGSRLFDFGCSWGYGSWQFARRGFAVEAFELSRPRAEYARTKLGVQVHDRLEDVKGPFDVFFSSHVLEHVPRISESIDYGMNLLRDGGLFIAFTPNGSDAFRQRDPAGWNKLWGMVHPNYLDEKFHRCAFAEHDHYIASSPHDLNAIREWAKNGGQVVGDLSGWELLLIARKRAQ